MHPLIDICWCRIYSYTLLENMIYIHQASRLNDPSSACKPEPNSDLAILVSCEFQSRLVGTGKATQDSLHANPFSLVLPVLYWSTRPTLGSSNEEWCLGRTVQCSLVHSTTFKVQRKDRSIARKDVALHSFPIELYAYI